MDLMQIRRGLMSQMANGIVKSELIGSYTVESAWETDSVGNPVTIFNTVSAALGISVTQLMTTQYFALVFRNNASASSYKGDFICRTKEPSYGSWALRNNKTAMRGYSPSVSLYASAGTIIDVYKITYNI